MNKRTGLMIFLLLLVGCVPGAANVTPKVVTTSVPLSGSAPLPSLPPTRIATSTVTPTLTATATTTPTQSPSATPTAAFALCSPLQDIALNEIDQPDLLKTPFEMPRPGFDDGHHGIDLAYWTRGEHKTMVGLPIYSVLQGTVAAVIYNRQPYGNAVIIETPLQTLPADWLAKIDVPAPAPTVPAQSSLNCSVDPVDYAANADGARSLYLLYAHMNQTPLVSAGETVTCGQAIGEVGTTGRSVNAHLHLETRVGPANARFAPMAHYDETATQMERATYCTWRVSGLFEMFDPLKLFK